MTPTTNEDAKMPCQSCGKEMMESTIRYHTPMGYERKLVVYECEYDSCMEDFTEEASRIATLEAAMKERDETIKALRIGICTMEVTGYNAVDYIAAANYPERELYARQTIQATASILLKETETAPKVQS